MVRDKVNFGIINIDKPTGPTSFSVSNYVRRDLSLKKASHLGTLDPKVTGVLPITLGRACRLSGFFMNHDKTYIGILHTHKEQNIKDLQKRINKSFLGKITQTPPHKSAVKRAPRIREVFQWELLEVGQHIPNIENELSDIKISSSNISVGKEFLFVSKVEGGTYIRKLCSDLGEEIGGAHMAELRRTKAGIFDETKMYTLNEFKEAIEDYKKGKVAKIESMITPADEAIKKVMPTIQIKKDAVKELYKGLAPRKDQFENPKEFEDFPENQTFAIFSESTFIEIAQKITTEYRIAKPLFVYN